MSRRARLSLPEAPHHIIQRGNKRFACFYAEEDYQLYLNWLAQHAAETHCDFHAFVLMTDHVHLLLTPREENSIGLLMKRFGQRCVQYINRTYKRSAVVLCGKGVSGPV
jgi:putative transposase